MTAPRFVVDDARQLDDAQLLEILQGFHARTTTVGAVATAATAAVAVALSPSLWFVGLALMPAAVGRLLHLEPRRRTRERGALRRHAALPARGGARVRRGHAPPRPAHAEVVRVGAHRLAGHGGAR